MRVVFDVYEFVVFFQAEDGIRDLVRSRGVGDVYKRQVLDLNLKKQEIKEEVQEELEVLSLKLIQILL